MTEQRITAIVFAGFAVVYGLIITAIVLGLPAYGAVWSFFNQ